jgi:hypothetical protein
MATFCILDYLSSLAEWLKWSECLPSKAQCIHKKKKKNEKQIDYLSDIIDVYCLFKFPVSFVYWII